MQRHPAIYFGPSATHGLGVFTADRIPAGSLLEICPVLVLPAEELELIHGSCLHDYYFLWGPQQDRPAIALGFGSLYNHAESPNAEFRLRYEDNTLHFVAIADIRTGQEITVDYHAGKREGVWFAVNDE